MTETTATALQPHQVTRTDGVTVRPDGRGKWTVHRGRDFLGTIHDEGSEMKRGRYAAWSPFAGPDGAGFHHEAGDAVEAVFQAWPVTVAEIVSETGRLAVDILAIAEAITVAWNAEGRRAVLRIASARGARTKMTRECAAEVIAVLTAEAAEVPAPEWRTLKGLEGPFLIWGEDIADGAGFRAAPDRKRVTGEPLKIVRTWMQGTRYGEDERGRIIHLWGVATKYWAAPAR